MFAKAAWFKRRKYGGWGVTPKTWQGWVYIAAMILPLIIFQALPYWSEQLRTYVTFGWVIFLLADLLPVMARINNDERESKNEAYAERNAAWFMMSILVLGLLYDIIISALNEAVKVNYFIVAAVLGGALVKSISNVYFDKKGV